MANGFRPWMQARGGCCYCSGAAARCSRWRWPGGVIPPHDGDGPQHIALGIATADYEVWRERLVVRHIAIESEIRWERGGRSLYFRDPDQHLVELVTPGIWPNY